MQAHGRISSHTVDHQMAIQRKNEAAMADMVHFTNDNRILAHSAKV